MNILYISAIVCGLCIFLTITLAYKPYHYVQPNNGLHQQKEFLPLYPYGNIYGNENDQPTVLSSTKKTSDTKLFEIVNEWKYLDFEYLTYEQRKRALENKEFIPENNLPLGIDFYENRIFITTPRWKDGVPASFGYLNYPPVERSPAIKPYPNWEAHGDPYNPDCSKLISVYRTFIDSCERIWLIDSGIVNATVSLNQICPPKILAYDLRTNKLLVHYDFPASQIKEDSLHSNIVVDVSNDRCDDAYAYVTDVWRFGIVVYSLRKNRSWRVTNYNFSPDPVASDFNVYGLNFQWLDGVFGMSLSLPKLSTNERVLYFHPMASFKEFMVSTSLLKDENIWTADAQKVAKYFVPIGERGKFGQSSTSGIAQNGVMFFTQVHRDDVGCWDTSKSYGQNNIHRFFENASNNNSTQTLIQFPNDLKVDHESLPHQSIWVISNRLPIYLYSQLNYDEINFRILKANVANIIANTVCDPLQSSHSLKDLTNT
ncbi:protein yellow [Lucilia cuprina]|uniref:protein yellow n=1 Tax=Lucilia cuprina TaxID=7375 RepID=UPI001F05EC6E|nr:protein yellow [Lucilia cuprina]